MVESPVAELLPVEDVAEDVVVTGQETVQGRELVNGRFVTILADANTGA